MLSFTTNFVEMFQLLTQHFDDWAPSGVSPNFLIQFFSAISSGNYKHFIK